MGAEASDEQRNNVSGLASGGPHLEAAVAVVLGVHFLVGVNDLELARVKGVQLNARIVDRVFERNDVSICLFGRLLSPWTFPLL